MVEFATVVFESELCLLELQARSMRRYLRPDQVGQLLVIDNCRRPLGRRQRTRLLAAYGEHAPSVRFVRPEELAQVKATGWQVQQVLKLAVSDLVTAEHYVALDAKDHFVAPVPEDYFVADGRAKVPAYSYLDHPLRPALERVLAYLGLNLDDHLTRFPATVTPFPLHTDTVKQLRNYVEERSGRPFAEEFVAQRLTEFFLYSGYRYLIGTADQLILLDHQSPRIWKGGARPDAVAATIAAADDPVFSVHRRALAAMDAAGRRQVTDFWTERELLAPGEAAGFVRRFRRDYLINETLRKLRNR
jgi:hypothetical protein